MHPKDLFTQYGGQFLDGNTVINVSTFRTEKGTPYLTEPATVLVAKPQVNLAGLRTFLKGFDESLNFTSYLDDTTTLEPGAQLCKTAGQACYASFGPKRTKNDNAQRYFNNIIDSGHGSVLEHANYSFLLYGISRSLTHELVRHRAGFGYSQLSQRYVSGRVLRFVERPEFQSNDKLHQKFINRIDEAYEDYHELADDMLKEQKTGSGILSAEYKTDLRKKVNQSARSLLPNETETLMIITGNVRAWRHFIEMRASDHSELEIRALAVRVFLCLRLSEPILFSDYELKGLSDGTYSVTTSHSKV